MGSQAKDIWRLVQKFTEKFEDYKVLLIVFDRWAVDEVFGSEPHPIEGSTLGITWQKAKFQDSYCYLFVCKKESSVH